MVERESCVDGMKNIPPVEFKHFPPCWSGVSCRTHHGIIWHIQDTTRHHGYDGQWSRHHGFIWQFIVRSCSVLWEESENCLRWEGESEKRAGSYQEKQWKGLGASLVRTRAQNTLNSGSQPTASHFWESSYIPSLIFWATWFGGFSHGGELMVAHHAS